MKPHHYAACGLLILVAFAAGIAHQTLERPRLRDSLKRPAPRERLVDRWREEHQLPRRRGAPARPPQIADDVSPDGAVESQTDLPQDERMRNSVGRDNAGLCVFTSIEHAGRWQNVKQVDGLQKSMRKELGGGYPDKVDTMMKRYCKGARYLQYEGPDPAVLQTALEGGRMPSVTYNGQDPFYGSNRKIAHMVNLVAYQPEADWAAILDNNHPQNLMWMSCGEFLSRWRGGRSSGWAVVLLNPPPPPPPKNRV